jgi:hypothetical protein
MVVSIQELLLDPGRRVHAAQPEMDALTENDALQEAQLVDVRFEALTGTAWLLFDCRQAIQLRMPNTAVLVVKGVRRLEWSGESRGARTAWNVVGSDPEALKGTFVLRLAFFPDAVLEIEGLAAEFFVGVVRGLGDAPPDFAEDDERTITSNMPSWESTFEPTHATFLDPEEDMPKNE